MRASSAAASSRPRAAATRGSWPGRTHRSRKPRTRFSSPSCHVPSSGRRKRRQRARSAAPPGSGRGRPRATSERDRKSTRLNSSHEWISYAVFCLKKKKKKIIAKPMKKKKKKKNKNKKKNKKI